MNSRQLKYVIELSEALNFSQVAERLGISQPALSKQISSLENELGVKLFDRSAPHLKLSAAGEHFVSEAKKLLFKEDMLLRSMEEFKDGDRGQVVIGTTPFRGQYLIPETARKFKEKYPKVKIVLEEAGSEQLRKETADGRFDLAIVNLPVDESVLDITPLVPDVLVLAVPAEYAKALPDVPKIALDKCKNIPFVTVGKNQEMRLLLEKSCAHYDFEPVIAMETVGISTAYAMCTAGIGATLIPIQYVNHMKKAEGIRLYHLEQNVYTRQPAVITRHGQYISEYTKYFIKLLTR